MTRLKYLTLLIIAFQCACQKESRISEMPLLSTNKVEIEGSSEEGVLLSASIIMDSKYEIQEQGFVYGLNKRPDVDADSVVVAHQVSIGQFSAEIDGLLMPDMTYYVRSFIKTAKHLVYGNEVSFYSNGSEAPAINKIEPPLAFWGDTIMITGERFDPTGENNSVIFNEFEAVSHWGTKDTIYAVVPAALNSIKSSISVKVYGKTSTNSKTFEILPPVIYNVSSTEGQYPDTVVVEGDNFYQPHLQMMLNGVSCQILSVKKKSVSFVVPMIGDGGNYSLSANQANEQEIVNPSFKYNEQIIYGLPKEDLWFGEPTVIKAHNVDFRRIKANLLINDQFYSGWSLMQRYQDSIVFTLKTKYFALSKQNSYQLSVGWQEEKHYHELFSDVFSFNDAEVALLDKETVVNGSLKTSIRGCGAYGKFYLTGPVELDDDFSLTYEGKLPLKYDLLPGDYQISYEDEFTGKKQVGEFIIKQPVISPLKESSLQRHSYHYFTVEGENLPLTKDTGKGQSLCRMQHVESGRVFDFYDESHLGATQFKPRWMMGRGTYELYLEAWGQRISNKVNVNFVDDFIYERTLPIAPVNNSSSKIIEWDGKILLDNKLYEYSSKQITDITGHNEIKEQLINYKGTIYCLSSYGKDAYVLNEGAGTWERLPISDKEVGMDNFFTYNDKLWIIFRNGDVYTLTNNEFTYHTSISDYQAIVGAYSYNDEIFKFKGNVIYVIDAKTFTYSDTISGYEYGSYYGWKSKTQFDKQIALYNQNEYVLFDMATKKFSRREINALPGRWQVAFYGNDKGELFIQYGNYTYKYDPQ